MLTKINNMYQNRFISKASAKVLLFYDICKFFAILEPVHIEPSGVVVLAVVAGAEETDLCTYPMSFHGLERLTGFGPMLAVRAGVKLSLLFVVHLQSQKAPLVRYRHFQSE